MNIQIFGRSKCFDTKKAERYFKERRIKFQSIDLPRYGMSKKEFESVRSAVGLEALIDDKAPDADLLKYMASDSARIERLLEYPDNIRTPIAHGCLAAVADYGGASAEPFFCWLYLATVEPLHSNLCRGSVTFYFSFRSFSR